MDLSGTMIKLDPTDSTSRAIVPDNATELGQALTAAALQKRISVKQNSLIACTEDFYRQKEVLKQRIAEAQARMDQLDERIADVTNGKFAVTEDARIIFPHLPAPHIG